MSETALLTAVIATLRYEPGCKVMRNNSGARKGGKLRFGLGTGSADLICVVRGGRFVALELKVGKGKQSAEQWEWQKEIEALGGRYAVVRSVEDARRAVRLWREPEARKT